MMKSIRSPVVSIVLLLLLSLDGSTAKDCKIDADCGDEGTCVGLASQIPTPQTCGHGHDVTCYSPGGTCTKPWTNNNRGPKTICLCEEGFSGEQCENMDAATTAAVAAAVGQCQCKSGFMGDMCEIPVKECGYHSRCQYDGKCVKPWTQDNRSKYWICHCPEGRTGKECETLLSDVQVDNGELSAGGKLGTAVGVMLFAGALFYAFISLGARRHHTNNAKKHDGEGINMEGRHIGDDKPYTDEPQIEDDKPYTDEPQLGEDKLYTDEFVEEDMRIV